MKDISALSADLKAYRAQISNSEIALLVAEKMKTDILFRTSQSLDVYGSQFKEYAPSTILKKHTEVVDLRDSGNLLGSILAKKLSKTKASVSISTAERKKAKYVEKTREFFGASENLDFSEILDEALDWRS